MNDSVLRIDKWLWFARFCKSRSLAAAWCVGGEVTLNGAVVTKPAQLLRPGDVLVIPAGPRRRRMVRVLALGARRGPASEARILYEELSATIDGAG